MNNKIKSILGSVLVIGIVASMMTVGTQSLFSDTETSTGNLLQAGSLDLKIDLDSYWNGDYYIDETTGEEVPVLYGEKHWDERDLDGDDVAFFYWDDVKPGDWGEMTSSLHVNDNDAWGWVRILPTVDDDNGLTEPEATDGDTTGGDGEGELDDYLRYYIWLDEGQIPGFQGKDEDPYEGNNIWDCWSTDGDTDGLACEPFLFNTDSQGKPLSAIRDEGEIGDFRDLEAYGRVPYLENCTTYYIGIYWWLPIETGNIVQTDSWGADFYFYVEQKRNNPNPNPWAD